MVAPEHAPIPSKMVMKITGGHFVDLANLLSVNLHTMESEPQPFLDGKLVISTTKRRQVELRDILNWTEAFTIYQMVMCSTHPNRWSDPMQYKLLIIQTARQFPGQTWLEYNLAFKKDVVATALRDWSKNNSDLNNFHLRSAATLTTRQLLQSSASSFATVSSSHKRRPETPYCHSWKEGMCCWPFGRCRFRHACQKCDGEHPGVSCPFQSSTGHLSRSRSLAAKGRRF